jgi:hypothetical protein
MDTKAYEPKNKNMPDLSWLVFNCTEQDQKLARLAFIEKYGWEKWGKFKKERISTGIMELFSHAQDEPAIFYANFIGKRVDERSLKAAEAAEKAVKIKVMLGGLPEKEAEGLASFLGSLADDGYIDDPRGLYLASDSSGDTRKLTITVNTDPAKSAQDIRTALAAFATAVGKRG